MHFLFHSLLFLISIENLRGLRISLLRSTETPAINRLPSRHPLYQQRLSSRRNVEYFVIVDSGSAMFWIPKINCSSIGTHVGKCQGNHELFNPQLSSTTQETNETFYIRYATGTASGRYHKDFVSLGIENYALHFKSPLRFGVGEEMTNTEVGVLGLAPPNANNLNDSVLGTGLDQGLFRLPIFTIHLKKCKTKNGSCEDGGSLTIGDFDPLNCHRVLIWIPLATYNSPEWKIHLDGFQINGKYTMNPTEALVDSGTSTLVVDRVVLDQIVKTIGAMKRYDKYIVPCNTHFTFSIVIENQVFDIMSSDLLLEIGRNYCQLAIDEGAYGLWLLGDPLYLRFCVAHNFQDRTVGLAPAIL
ncbi:Gastricsin [Aphelenchoides besseyi]|nr:Gastricsin [Aphelenchoides besseyi]